MTSTNSLHGAIKATARNIGDTSWFHIQDAAGNVFTIFCPRHVAEATADAFNLAMSEAEGDDMAHASAEGSA